MTVAAAPRKMEATAEGAQRVLAMINANWMAQAIGAATRLGVPEALAAGPRSSMELAEALACDRGALERLLRSLASLGLTAKDGGLWRLTADGASLRGDALWSVRAWALWTAHGQWDLWPHLADSVRTGRSARALTAGLSGYEHLEAGGPHAQVFHAAMVELTRLLARHVVARLDLRNARHIVDIGGGHGELLVSLLQAHPGLRGTLLELPHALPGAREHAAAAGVQGRCELLPGSFFDPWPRADVYLLKSILHNWDDAGATRILERAAQAGGRLVLLDRVLPDAPADTPVDRVLCRTDLNMLVSFGGRERTRSELACLLRDAGLMAADWMPLESGFVLVDARCA